MIATNRRVEKTTRNPEEHPGRNGQREAEGDADEHHLVDGYCVGWRDSVSDLCRCESEVEEECGSDEFARHGNEVGTKV